jgi:hypothetical protein
MFEASSETRDVIASEVGRGLLLLLRGVAWWAGGTVGGWGFGILLEGRCWVSTLKDRAFVRIEVWLAYSW